MMTLAELLKRVAWENLTIRKEFVDGNKIASFNSCEIVPEKYLNSKVNEDEFCIYNDGLGCLSVEAGLLWI